MTTARAAADNLMLTGTVLYCPDCGDDRILVVAECDDGAPGDHSGDRSGDRWGDYCCTDCGAAVSFAVEGASPRPSPASRVA